MSDRQSTITNYLTASEELKSKAEEAERAYTQALNDARSEAHVYSTPQKRNERIAGCH